MTENKKKLQQQQNLRQVFELYGTPCLALTSFGAHNSGHTATLTLRPNARLYLALRLSAAVVRNSESHS